MPMTLAIMSDGMSDGLKDDDTTEPTVNEIVRVERDVQERDKRIVSSS